MNLYSQRVGKNIYEVSNGRDVMIGFETETKSFLDV